MPQVSMESAHLHNAQNSWMLPEAKSEDLLYVTSQSFHPANEVLVFSYPGEQLVGKLAGFKEADGSCTDAAGDVFIADIGAAEVVEYAHGGSKAIKRLRDASSGFIPSGCAVNSTTGDLAVTSGFSVFVYANAKGKPKYYYNLLIGAAHSCAYDNKGNLFIAGGVLAELPKRGDKIIRLSVRRGKIDRPGAVQWDGKYFVVGRGGENGSTEVDRLSVSGSKATIEARIPLEGSTSVVDFWIYDGTLIAPNFLSSPCSKKPGCVENYDYPQGGNATKTLKVYYPSAATISIAK
jgi:hypothetical protein